MKIVHIISGLGRGGAELMLERLVTSHFSERKDYLIISIGSLGDIGKSLSAAGVKVIALNLRFDFKLLLGIFNLIFLLRKERADIIQTWMYHADLIGGFLGRMLGDAKVIWGVRTTDLVEGSTFSTKALRKLSALLSHFVPHAIICPAEASRRSHILIGYKPSLFHVIPNGFITEAYEMSKPQRQFARLQFGFSHGDCIIGCLGRFHPAKDHYNFVQAAQLVASTRSDVRFFMVGRGLNSANAELADWIARTGYADRFLLMGERQDVPQCLAAMDIFCLPSRTEGFPNVVGEAMAMGLPCVVTDAGDAAFLLGDCGLVVPKADPLALAGGLCEMAAKSSTELAAIGEKGKARVKSEFSMGRSLDRYEAVYQQVLK
jgi:glycosyltransferase involved in cell wall biosynthesis